MNRATAALIGTLAAFGTPQADAQAPPSYPAKPVRIVNPFAPGGNTDVVSRAIADRLTPALKQQVIVEHRPGAMTNIASEAVAKAPADGYMLLMGGASNAINMSLFNKLPYDTVRDFDPITLCVQGANVLSVHPSVPAKNLRELIALAKAQPGKLNYASASVASVGHLTGELINQLAGINMTHIAYKGSGQAVTDLLGGHVQLMYSGFSSTLLHIKSGKLRAIAQTGAKRSPALPDVPTIAESGFPGFEATAWYGVHAPARTPKAIVARLNSEFVKALKLPDVRERLSSLGFEISGSTPEFYGNYIKSEIKKWAKVVKASGAKPE